MAKQAEGFIVGTYDDITFYKMEGQYYARMKSSLTGKKFWKHKAFEGSRRSCGRFGRGNQLASLVYNEIEESIRIYALYCRMKSKAIAMLKAGATEDEVIGALRSLKPKTKPRAKVVTLKVVLSQPSLTNGLFCPVSPRNYNIKKLRRSSRGRQQIHVKYTLIDNRQRDG